MTSLGFENYGEALKIYLARYREVSKVPYTVSRILYISYQVYILTQERISSHVANIRNQ